MANPEKVPLAIVGILMMRITARFCRAFFTEKIFQTYIGRTSDEKYSVWLNYTIRHLVGSDYMDISVTPLGPPLSYERYAESG
jgi:hypothetical protein